MSLNLLINQIDSQFSNSKNNVYSDERREEHFINIYKIFSSIKHLSNTGVILSTDIPVYKQILQYIISDLQYLDNSTLNVIPFEIISCLELALKDWIDDDNLILSTSLSNNFNDLYFSRNKEFFDHLNIFLSSKSLEQIKYRQIRISLPKILSRDYLATVSLYHELGHFIDAEYNISKRILSKISKSTIIADEKSFLNHTAEYFADLFAAQYISDASNQYLYDRTSYDNDSYTHPSTSKRITLVDDFLNMRPSSIIDDFKEIVELVGKKIELRFEEKTISNSNFYKFIPEILENDKQLHYIYKIGWGVWKDNTSTSFIDLPEKQKYQMLNNLIEKSISSYFLLKSWNNKS
ncbi:hypothetical protein [Chryseobacterium polytrichastri]|uniref:Uncharacterized protein n=1 Tax=Chryseobacterium polytrichastri TaxID=1302687 RepID=A0A1M7EWZ7_9FLAO|nr:hypothetical protein [Chryseobacterium polytrichastri]SHL96220.1 hypothetical protein SAMN05444267_102963 [Chryseobacterium polytrichastri]